MSIRSTSCCSDQSTCSLHSSSNAELYQLLWLPARWEEKTPNLETPTSYQIVLLPMYPIFTSYSAYEIIKGRIRLPVMLYYNKFQVIESKYFIILVSAIDKIWN